MIWTTEFGGLSLVLPERRDAKWRSDHVRVQREVIKQHLNAVPSRSIAKDLGITGSEVSAILKAFKAFVAREAY
jgi:hypothetical protein